MRDLRKYLNDLLIERCKSNKNYSLRAFARDLKFAPSTLSEILNGKRPLSKRLRERIGKALKLSSEEIATFVAQNHGNSLASHNDVTGSFNLSMALSKSELPVVQDEIKRFKRRLKKKLEELDDSTESYKIAISLITPEE